MDRKRQFLQLISIIVLGLSGGVAGQGPAEDSTGTAPKSQDVAPPADTTPVGVTKVTVAAVESVKQQALDAEQLNQEAKDEIVAVCDKALARLTESGSLAQATISLQRELDEASTALKALEAPAEKTATKPIESERLTVDQLRSQLSAADQKVGVTRDRLSEIAAEIERRATRRKELPEALTKCREQLTSAEEALKHPIAVEPPMLGEARRLLQLSRRDLFRAQLKWLEQEQRTYEATARLWLARRDQEDKKLQSAVHQHDALRKLAAEVQQREAKRQTREAREAAVRAHPAVKEAAARNTELAEQNQKLVSDMQRTQIMLAEARELGNTMRYRLEDIQKRVNAAKNSPAIGAMLKRQQEQMPDLRIYRERLRNRPIDVAKIGLDKYEWESERRNVLHVDDAVHRAVTSLGDLRTANNSANAISNDIGTALRRVLETRAEILAELITNAQDHISHLEQLDVAEAQIVETTDNLASFVAEQVMWVRSAPILSVDDIRYSLDFCNDLGPLQDHVEKIGHILSSDMEREPVSWGLVILIAIGTVATRRRARCMLQERGVTAARPAIAVFRPTLDAASATILLALPGPLVLGFIGWRLSQTNDQVPQATGWALVFFASAYAMLDLIWHTSRPGGLGTHHFLWNERGLAAVRRVARAVQFAALPLLAVAVGVDIAGNQATVHTLGRLGLMASLLVVVATCFRLFLPASPLTALLITNSHTSWSARAARTLAPFVMLSLLALVAASAAGYHYTAMQLSRRVFVSLIIIFLFLGLRSLLLRWLTMAYRRTAIQLAREKRQAMVEARENGANDTSLPDAEPAIRLNDINEQARKLVRVASALAFAGATWCIWGDMLPALGIFSRVELWPSGVASADPDVGPAYVTLADLCLTFGILGFTWFATRNLPGLLEITVLRRLPFDAGARYAITSVTRYTLMVVGAALGMRQLGISWNNVQWLVAAMTVGLGFGLQEIFANFVSGIILLLERPARVGDTVTIGEITGTITKIRIRATTILDWDNKELVIPNKAFVTGNLVNWTLTNADLRLVIKVGVAYGSNTRLVTDLLYRVASDNPRVLEEPAPVVVFNAFGDSSLNFELRLFVPDLTLYRCLRHELHLEIEDSFRRHGIEIAFPQCDLHIRSMPADFGKSEAASSLNDFPDVESAAA